MYYNWGGGGGVCAGLTFADKMSMVLIWLGCGQCQIVKE